MYRAPVEAHKICLHSNSLRFPMFCNGFCCNLKTLILAKAASKELNSLSLSFQVHAKSPRFSEVGKYLPSKHLTSLFSGRDKTAWLNHPLCFIPPFCIFPIVWHQLLLACEDISAKEDCLFYFHQRFIS